MEVVFLFITFWTWVFIFRNNWVYRNMCRIGEVIHDYNYDCIEKNEPMDLSMYDRIRSYDCMLFRVWDWDATHFLLLDDYQKIKSFLKETNSANESIISRWGIGHDI